MKKHKFFYSLPFKLLLGVAIGICSGLFLNFIDESAITTAVLNVVVTLKYVLGQLINFCVPLIIIGFIAPSITKLGSHASRMLGVAVGIAYASSLGAALFSAFSGYILIPHLSISSSADHLKTLPDVIFELSIPQIMPVMSALALSIMLGLAAAWTKASLISSLLDEFQKIVLAIVSRIIIPVLPLFIGLTFCSLAYEGTITKAASCLPQGDRHCPDRPFYLDDTSLPDRRSLFRRKSSGSSQTLRAGLSDSDRNHVVCRHTRSSPPVCRKGKAAAQRYGTVWNSSVFQHPSVWFCSHRSLLLHDGLQDSLRCSTCTRKHGVVLYSPWHLCHRSSGRTRRNCHGFSGADHRDSEIR